MNAPSPLHDRPYIEILDLRIRGRTKAFFVVAVHMDEVHGGGHIDVWNGPDYDEGLRFATELAREDGIALLNSCSIEMPLIAGPRTPDKDRANAIEHLRLRGRG